MRALFSAAAHVFNELKALFDSFESFFSNFCGSDCSLYEKGDQSTPLFLDPDSDKNQSMDKKDIQARIMYEVLTANQNLGLLIVGDPRIISAYVILTGSELRMFQYLGSISYSVTGTVALLK